MAIVATATNPNITSACPVLSATHPPAVARKCRPFSGYHSVYRWATKVPRGASGRPWNVNHLCSSEHTYTTFGASAVNAMRRRRYGPVRRVDIVAPFGQEVEFCGILMHG